MSKKSQSFSDKKSLNGQQKDIKNQEVDLKETKEILKNIRFQQQETDRIVKENAIQMKVNRRCH